MTAPATPLEAAPLIEANNLRRSYNVSRGAFAGSAEVKAVDGVSFAVWPSRTLAIVGESGCGKSTLARVVSMIEPPSSGDLRIAGIDLTAATADDRRSLRPRVQFVFQDPFGSLNPRKTVGAIIGEPLVINANLSRAERREQVAAIMQRVGLRSEHYDRYPHMFSGGQRQRIAIARALIMRPDVVVCDEPVSALDVSIQAQVLNLLMDLQQEFGLAYIFISHDLSVVRYLADDVMVMYLGRIVEHGTRDAVFGNPTHPYTRALLASTPHIDPTRRATHPTLTGETPSPLDPPSGCAFHTRCPFAVDQCAVTRPELLHHGDHVVACHRTEELPPP